MDSRNHAVPAPFAVSLGSRSTSTDMLEAMDERIVLWSLIRKRTTG
jgi:hypothetical protein